MKLSETGASLTENGLFSRIDCVRTVVAETVPHSCAAQSSGKVQPQCRCENCQAQLFNTFFSSCAIFSETGSDYDNAQTGCCALINPEDFDGKEFMWDNKLFVKDHIRSFLHMPLNFGSVMGRMHTKVEAAEAYPENGIMLSDETSLWGADAYLEVDREVPGCEMASMSGTFLTKVFEGPYSNMRQWIQEMEEYVGSQNKELKKMYFYYTACPKCAKTFGKNYVVIFAQVA